MNKSINPSEKFEKIIDRITDAFFIVDPEGVLSYASASVSRLFGYSPQELNGRSALDFIHPEEHETAKENQEELLSYPGNRLTFDYRILNKHHNYQWMECIFVNMMNIPQVAGIMVQMRDVSERKSMELLLHDSREKFRLFMNCLPAIAIIRDDEGRYVFVNDTFSRMVNKKREDIVGRNYHELFPEHVERIKETDRLCLDLGREIQYLEHSKEQSGVEREWIVYKFPVPAATGKTYIGTLGFDVSKINVAKAEVQQAEDKFQIIFNHAPDAIFIEDELGYILDANLKACELQGLSLSELIGKHILDLTPQNKRAEVMEQYRDLWSGTITSLKSFTWRINGAEIPVSIHSAKIKHKGQEALILTLRAEKRSQLSP